MSKKELNINELQEKLDKARDEYEDAKSGIDNMDDFDEDDFEYFVTDESDDEYGVFLSRADLHFSDPEIQLQFDNASRKIKLYSLLKQLAENPDRERLKEEISSQVGFGELEAKRVVEMEEEYLSELGEMKELIGE